MTRNIVLTGILTLLFGLSAVCYAEDPPSETDKFSYNSNQVLHPEWYIDITKWSFFSAARVGMLSSVTIENTADVAYKDIKIKIYFTTYGSAVGIITTNTAVLPVTVPPNSKDTYLRGGITVGGGKQNYKVTDIQVLSATPIRN